MISPANGIEKLVAAALVVVCCTCLEEVDCDAVLLLLPVADEPAVEVELVVWSEVRGISVCGLVTSAIFSAALGKSRLRLSICVTVRLMAIVVAIAMATRQTANAI